MNREDEWECSNCRFFNSNSSEICENCNEPRPKFQHLSAELKAKFLSMLHVHDLYHLQRELCQFSVTICGNLWRQCMDSFFPRIIGDMYLMYSMSNENGSNIVFATKGDSVSWVNSHELMDLKQYLNYYMDIKTYEEVFQANVNIETDYRANYSYLQASDNSIVFVEFFHPFGRQSPMEAFRFITDFTLLKLQTEHTYLTIELQDSESGPHIKHLILVNATCHTEEHPDWNDPNDPPRNHEFFAQSRA